mmetsp:Transcript_7785/g.21708  ORF Transcript_7785/g.21708 Transcript_7785/m.21708 type:complete len:84 (-) Transcript_7785:7-258(-)
MNSLTPNVLAKEFAKIDEANDERISKEDFLEFCAFLSDCQDEHDEACRKNPTNPSSVRKSLAVSMTVEMFCFDLFAQEPSNTG